MAAKRQRLAARRKAVGLTQEQLAERLGVERSTVVYDMTTVAVGQATAALLAQAYARVATADALPFPDGLRAVAGQEQAERVTNVLASLAFLGGTAARMPAMGDDQVRDQLAQFLCGWIETMDRRELIQLLGWAADTGEQQRLARAVASPSLVDARVIDHIAAMLRLRLFLICSDMSTSIGSSRRYYDQARAAAHNSGSVELGIYALCEWSSTEPWQDQAPTGPNLAVAAQNLVSKAEDPLMRVGAAQRAATVYAFDGQYNECMVECERAQNGLVTVAGSASDESPRYFYNDGYSASHRSEFLLRLGKPQEAAVSACAGLMLYDKSFKELDDRLENYDLRRSGAR